MKKNIFISLLIFIQPFIRHGGDTLMAQQDPQYSQYMFNQLAINPAYAGTKDALSTSMFLRTQWTGIGIKDGAPTTETFTIHSPLRKRKIGVGFTVISDQIGPKKSIGALASYAYKIPIRKGKLSFGLRMGVYQYTYNWYLIDYKDKLDPLTTAQTQTKTILPSADAGIYYYTSTMYAGFSATQLFKGHLSKDVPLYYGYNTELERHLFFTVGKAWALSDKLVFNPSCMIKSVANAPGAVDVNFSFLLDQRVWAGFSARIGYGMVFYTQFNITEKFRLGYSYDWGFNKIGTYGGGSHEIMLGYDFNLRKSKMFSPRYF